MQKRSIVYDNDHLYKSFISRQKKDREFFNCPKKDREFLYCLKKIGTFSSEQSKSLKVPYLKQITPQKFLILKDLTVKVTKKISP